MKSTSNAFDILRSSARLLALIMGLPALVCAVTLQAQVDEVRSGDRIVVSNINRPLLVKLKGIAPPEKGQPFTDEARERLSALILNKTVSVEYLQLDKGWLVAKVTCNGLDIGAQLIRDGVAWYDRANEWELNEADRLIYAKSEEMARNERRGLWQADQPVSPWQYRESQTLPVVRPVAPPPPAPPRQARRENAPSLSSYDLVGSRIGPGSIAGQPIYKALFAGGLPDSWRRFESPGKDFSILAPGDGTEVTYSVLDDRGQAVEFHYLVGTIKQTLYALLSTVAPNDHYTDASVATEAVEGLLHGFNSGSRSERAFAIEADAVRDIQQAGYVGRQYRLRGGPMTGLVRVLSKRIGDKRKIFVLFVLNGPAGDSDGAEFLNSLRLKGQ
jgi:endonuclease YncB( thermonuclease family)